MGNMIYIKIKNLKSISDEIVDALNRDEFNKVNELLDKRQQYIEEIKTIDFSQKEFEDACYELKLIEIEKEISEKIKLKMDKIKFDIRKLSEAKKAGAAYGRKNITDSLFYNKKF